MVWPIVAALGLATIVTSVRAGRRALVRLRNMPPEAFGIKSQYDDPKYHYGGFDEKMSTNEAMLVLGIHDIDRLTTKELAKRHRHTMLLNHPDRGGSRYMAMKINEAKDVLDKRLK